MVAERLLHVTGADNVGSLSLVRRFVLLLAIDGALYLFAGGLVIRVGGGAGACLLMLLVAVVARLPVYAGPYASPPILRKRVSHF